MMGISKYLQESTEQAPQSPKLEQLEQENKWNSMDYNPMYKVLINTYEFRLI